MGWLSDVFSGGDGSSGDRRRERDPRLRAAQLRKGVETAAAAVEDRHPEAAREAVEAADRLVGQVPGADPGIYDEHDPGHERPEAGGLEATVAGGERARELAEEAVDQMDRLHFALLRVSVQGASPEEAELEEAVRDTAGLAGRLEEEAGPVREAGEGA